VKKIILLILGLLFYSSAFAQVPQVISYSGKIVDKNGNLLSDGKYDMKFSLFTTFSGGIADWTEQHLIAVGKGVTVTGGGFDVTLGGEVPLPNFSSNYYLQTEVYISNIWENFGRREVKSVAYARRAEVANRVIDNSVTTVKIVDSSITTAKIVQGADLPVGTILSWHKNLAGVPALPSQYMECNGQQITDSASPMSGQWLPNLNGTNRFLRGSSHSGDNQEDAFQGHFHNMQGALSGGNGINWRGELGSFSSFSQTWEPISDGSHGTPRVDSETRPKNMSVVWIMKIK
jgi:hypothetical protein